MKWLPNHIKKQLKLIEHTLSHYNLGLSYLALGKKREAMKKLDILYMLDRDLHDSLSLRINSLKYNLFVNFRPYFKRTYMKFLIPPSEGKSKVISQDVIFADTNFQFEHHVNQVVRLLGLIEDENLSSVYGTSEEKAMASTKAESGHF